MQTALPDKYYLTHATELFSYIDDYCGALLQESHKQYLGNFIRLSSQAQCMLIRMLTRKPRFLKRGSLQYAEIDDCKDALAELITQGFASNVGGDQWQEFVPHLTKPQLLQCLESTSLNVKSSTSKAGLVELVSNYFTGHEASLARVTEEWVLRRKQNEIDYLLFLYFGDLRNRFQKFVLRDLGVVKTRGQARINKARFANLKEAESAFTLHKLRRDYLSSRELYQNHTIRYIREQQPHGDSAIKAWNKLVLSLGSDIVCDDSELAIKIWECSDHPKALEQKIRTSYKHGNRDSLREELKSLQTLSLDPSSRLFINDFYARKYDGKKTSIYTDMLREATLVVALDESYLGSVEEGVIQHHRRNSQQAWFTENKLWHVLFAFTLWPILYGDEQVQYTEFDFLPTPLRDKNFYANNKNAIELRLELLDQPALAIKEFTKIAATNYGTPTGIFSWSATMLDYLAPCVNNAPNGSLATVIRQMADDYKNSASGYPDLMIYKEGQLRFVEVKAPGDVLRANQLISIEKLRQAGLTVDICQVEWATDPDQVYAVVDIETTGGRKGNNSITEIAVVKVQNKKVIDEWSSLVNPGRAIPPHITRLTGINNQMVANAPRFGDLADELEIQLDQAIFVAHNVGFDYGFIKAAFEELGRRFRKPKYCTVKNSRKTFPGLKSYSLGNLAAEFDLDLHNAHRALSDARATADLLRLIQEKRSSD